MTHLAHAGYAAWPSLTVRTAVAGTLEIIAVPIEATQATVQLTGDLDDTTAGLLSADLEEQLTQGHRSVRLDLSRLTFLDCAGLRVLVLAHNRFLHAGGTLVLTGVQDRIARLLHITHLDEALLIADGAVRPSRARHLVSVPNPDSDADPETR